uniref:Arrestin C-terminal-like domain-containing protein n=1 Tax=Pundamilia nyererei TaxID=303518 RepID=A0A3B4H004_9CICH
MSPIKNLNVTFETISDNSSYSEGDTIVGTVSFRLTKEVKVKSVYVKAKGDANVEWTEVGVPVERLQSARRRYFKVKEYLVAENDEGRMSKSNRVFLLYRRMPSSFKGKHGNIVYTFEAKVSRRWRLPSKVLKEINFVSKSCPHTPQMMSSSVRKKMSGLCKGQVQICATINRGVCSPGETLSVVAKICNSSSRNTRLKFKLQQVTVYSCQDNTNSSKETLFKMVGDTIRPNSEQTASCQLKVPSDAIPTIHNCEIISVEYYIKVYLDVSFALDPEVVFPLVILPSKFAPAQSREAVGPETVESPAYSEFTSSTFTTGLDPILTGSGVYQYPTPDPTQHANITSDYNQWPQGAASQGSVPAFIAPSVQHPGPTALHGEEPPLYLSIYQETGLQVSFSQKPPEFCPICKAKQVQL